MINSKVRIFFTIKIILVLGILSASTPVYNTNSTLQLVHILFRHGDRTTDTLTIYPNDPYINETYYPYGPGELTNKGKQREYQLGKTLRERYGDFLGEIYTPNILEAYSSNVNRTKASLQLVLAGLFPPVGELIWDPVLCWQPIPFSILPLTQDKLFFGILCPNFQKQLREYISSPQIMQEMEQYQETFEYLSENSGMNVTSYWDAFFIHVCLTTEEQFGLELPQWTEKVYPEPLEEIAAKSYRLLTGTTDLRRMASGYLLQKILDDTNGKIDGQPGRGNRKIYLYSGHEINIAILLNTLDVAYEEHIPPYGSYVALELHTIDGVNGFKIYYQNSEDPELQLLRLPACDEFCPLDKFIYLTEEYMPSENLCNVIN